MDSQVYPYCEMTEDGDQIQRTKKQQSLPTYKYTRLIENIQHHIQGGDKFFSLEFFPPRTANGAANLIGRLESNSIIII